MFITALAHYVPETILDNHYFSHKTGIPDEEILKKSGISQRRKASGEENTNTMSVRAVENLVSQLPFDIRETDLIVGATYTPYDTIATLAHAVQQHFQIPDARVLSLSTACSSFANAIEVVQGYFALKKARRALVIACEHNTIYNNEADCYSGFLWGDGAAAAMISSERLTEGDIEILDVDTRGHALSPKATRAVCMKPYEDKLTMTDGRDIFIHASRLMAQTTLDILKQNNLNINDLKYVIPHQANMRIIGKIAENLGLSPDAVITNIEYLGNTGCAGSAIALSESHAKFVSGDVVVLTVFGGGYSSGSVLMRR